MEGFPEIGLFSPEKVVPFNKTLPVICTVKSSTFEATNRSKTSDVTPERRATSPHLNLHEVVQQVSIP